MKYIVPIEIEVVAKSGAEAEQSVYELVQQATFAWRKVYNTGEFYVKDAQEVSNS